MQVILDEHGQCYPDVRMNEKARQAISTQHAFHVANEAAICAFRAELSKIPVGERPHVDWEFYGETVHFDDDLRSDDAWGDPRTEIFARNLDILLSSIYG